MSYSLLSPRAAHLDKFIKVGNNLVASASADGTSESVYENLKIGVESARSEERINTMAGVDTKMESALSRDSLKIESAAARAAGAAILGAAGHEHDYCQMVGQESAKTSDYLEPGYMGTYGTDYGSTSMVGTEYYTEKDLDKNLGLSYAMNVRALETQSDFAETLYPTITVDAGDAGVSIRTKITTIYKGMRHALYKKDSVPAERRNLVDALTDHTVLDDDAIALVPYFLEGAEGNVSEFVSKDIIEPTDVQLGRVAAYATSYLKFGSEERNLFSLAAHPGIAAEGYDETDEIAPGAALSRILVSIRKKGEALEAGKLVELNVQNMQYATFQRPAEGGGRELILNFRQNKFGLTGETVDRNGDKIPALAQLENQQYRMQYTIRVRGEITVNDGMESIDEPQVKVTKLINSQGQVEPHDKGTGKTLVDNIIIDAVGFKYAMTRTNENRRTQGSLLESIWETENFKLRLGSPLTTKSPIGAEGIDDAERLDDLISAVNIRNESLSITQTLNYTEQLEQLMPTLVGEYDKVSIQGLGRHWVRPWFERKPFRVNQSVSTLESKHAAANARASILTALGDQVTRAVQESRYMPALRTYMADPKARPTVVLACDEVTASMLLCSAPGEMRLLGDRYDFKIVTTNDTRWREMGDEQEGPVRRLQWFLHVPSEGGAINVLNWGNHFWTPVLVTNTNIQRSGSVSKELTVQPRNLHVCHCPVTGVLDVTGITEYATTKPSLDVDVAQSGEETTPDVDLEGLNANG